jgi:hypothetical protein
MPLGPGRITCAAAALVAAAPAAAMDGDIQAWATVNLTAPVSNHLSVNVEAQTRLTDDVTRAGQVSLRPSISWRIADTRTLLLGYAYLRSDPLGGAVRNEHRIWQQAAYRIAGRNGVRLYGRTRLEQRFVAGRDDTGWRIRQQLRITAPIGGARAVVSGEPFYALNGTEWGQRQGFDQLRTFAGVNIPLNDVASVEPGYLNQMLFRRGEDRMNHIASLTLNLRI